MVSYGIIWYSMISYGTVWHHMVSYGIIINTIIVTIFNIIIVIIINTIIVTIINIIIVAIINTIINTNIITIINTTIVTIINTTIVTIINTIVVTIRFVLWRRSWQQRNTVQAYTKQFSGIWPAKKPRWSSLLVGQGSRSLGIFQGQLIPIRSKRYSLQGYRVWNKESSRKSCLFLIG